MKNVYALLLSLLGLVCIIFNRFAASETFRFLPIFPWTIRSPVWLGRIVAIISGTFFVVFGLMMALGYLE